MTKPRKGETFQRCRLGYAPLGLVLGLACLPTAHAVGYRSYAAPRLRIGLRLSLITSSFLCDRTSRPRILVQAEPKKDRRQDECG